MANKSVHTTKDNEPDELVPFWTQNPSQSSKDVVFDSPCETQKTCKYLYNDCKMIDNNEGVMMTYEKYITYWVSYDLYYLKFADYFRAAHHPGPLAHLWEAQAIAHTVYQATIYALEDIKAALSSPEKNKLLSEYAVGGMDKPVELSETPVTADCPIIEGRETAQYCRSKYNPWFGEEEGDLVPIDTVWRKDHLAWPAHTHPNEGYETECYGKDGKKYATLSMAEARSQKVGCGEVKEKVWWWKRPLSGRSVQKTQDKKDAFFMAHETGTDSPPIHFPFKVTKTPAYIIVCQEWFDKNKNAMRTSMEYSINDGAYKKFSENDLLNVVDGLATALHGDEDLGPGCASAGIMNEIGDHKISIRPSKDAETGNYGIGWLVVV